MRSADDTASLAKTFFHNIGLAIGRLKADKCFQTHIVRSMSYRSNISQDSDGDVTLRLTGGGVSHRHCEFKDEYKPLTAHAWYDCVVRIMLLEALDNRMFMDKCRRSWALRTGQLRLTG